MRYIGILLEFSENMRYIGIPDPQNEVYWYGIEIRSKSEISNNEVYWYIWPNFGKVRYFGMKPYIVGSYYCTAVVLASGYLNGYCGYCGYCLGTLG